MTEKRCKETGLYPPAVYTGPMIVTAGENAVQCELPEGHEGPHQWPPKPEPAP